jgi:2'-5' RNA ligase
VVGYDRQVADEEPPRPVYHLYVPVPSRQGRPMADVTRRCPGQPQPVPHVTLIGPAEIVSNDREPGLVAALHVAVRAFAPFTITYDGVEYFGKKHYIYVPVLLTPGLASRQDVLRAATDRFLEPSYQSSFPFRPHITLAAHLFEWEGEAIWRTLKDRRFTGAFVCREMHLMRLPAANGPWQRLARLRLAGTPSD